MKKLVIAAGLLTLLGASASAQPYGGWQRGNHPYAREHHGVCQDKARRLYRFESRASADGRLSRYEREEIRFLQRDLDRTCGRYRWRG